MEHALFCGNREPTLDEILAEPIVRQIMKRDGWQEAEIRQLVGKVEGLRPAKIRWLAAEREAKPGAFPQASIGVLAQSQSTIRAWPRVFPGL